VDRALRPPAALAPLRPRPDPVPAAAALARSESVAPFAVRAKESGIRPSTALAALVPSGSLLAAGLPARAISFITQDNQHCYKPARGHLCYVDVGYLYVNASPNYMLHMTVYVDDVVVLRLNAFFQQYLSYSADHVPAGFPVACGYAGTNAKGDLELGGDHKVTVRAEDSSAMKSANYGTVTCPAGDKKKKKR
jgi:hypothetical protein